MKTDRLIRTMELRAVKEEGDSPSYKVRGYAATYEPYVLWKDGDYEVWEVLDRKALDEADMSDVVLRIDHIGPVYARNKAGNLTLSVDEHGLYFEADLSQTENQRRLYEDIEAGLYPQASYAFTVEEDSYNKETKTRTLLKINKLYDVSPVSFPANPDTEVDIATRGFLDGVIEREKAERLLQERKEENEARRDALKLKLLKERMKR